MPFESPGFYFLMMAALLAFAALPAMRALDGPAALPGRHVALDGLRGFLALGVFVFHLVVTREYVAQGTWNEPRTRFYAHLGPIGVSAFFMLTGFLFWTRLLDARGRPDWTALFIGRFWRIVPMYLVVVIAMLAIVAVRSGFERRVPWPDLLGAMAQWLAFGLVDTQPDVNGHQATHVLAGVTWTLWYEWAFYAALPLVALLARGRWHLALVVIGLLLCLAAKGAWQSSAAGYAALFALGMTVASLRHVDLMPRWPVAVSSGLALACLLLVFIAAPQGYGSVAALLLAVFLYLVCGGATLFGLLLTPAAQRLGHISYSLYLMQGLVLSLVFAMAPIKAYALGSTLAYWAVGLVCGLLLVVAASAGYLWIEIPGIAWGRRLNARRLQRPVAHPGAPQPHAPAGPPRPERTVTAP